MSPRRGPRARSPERDMYEAIADELGGGLTLDQLDQDMVKKARRWARQSHYKWPPRPANPDLASQIIGLTLPRLFAGGKEVQQ